MNQKLYVFLLKVDLTRTVETVRNHLDSLQEELMLLESKKPGPHLTILVKDEVSSLKPPRKEFLRNLIQDTLAEPDQNVWRKK